MYRVKVTFRQGSSTTYRIVMAEGMSESAAKAALVRSSSAYSNAEILNVEPA